MTKRRADKKDLFPAAYLANNFNASAAAVSVGYSKRSAREHGHRIMNRPEIKKKIAEKIKKMEDKLDITFEWKLKKLKQIVDECVREHPDGTVLLTNAGGGISAIAELNKMEGHYAAEKRVTANFNVDTDIETVKENVKEFERPY